MPRTTVTGAWPARRTCMLLGTPAQPQGPTQQYQARSPPQRSPPCCAASAAAQPAPRSPAPQPRAAQPVEEMFQGAHESQKKATRLAGPWMCLTKANAPPSPPLFYLSKPSHARGNPSRSAGPPAHGERGKSLPFQVGSSNRAGTVEAARRRYEKRAHRQLSAPLVDCWRERVLPLLHQQASSERVSHRTARKNSQHNQRQLAAPLVPQSCGHRDRATTPLALQPRHGCGAAAALLVADAGTYPPGRTRRSSTPGRL